jgi:cation transport ATPase
MDRPSAGRAFLARSAFLAFAAVGTGAGTVAALAGAEFVADASWFVVALVALVVSVSSVVRSLRRGRVGVDVVAVAALIGTVVAHELAAAAVVGLMLATGQLLEARASWRADRDLRVLLDRMPTVAHRWEAGELVDVPIDGLGAGDEVLVRPGEAVPVEGRRAGPAGRHR